MWSKNRSYLKIEVEVVIGWGRVDVNHELKIL